MRMTHNGGVEPISCRRFAQANNPITSSLIVSSSPDKLSEHSGMTIPISLRPFRSEDESLWYEIYASTRADEMALVDWSADQQQSFLQMQYNAQRAYYQMQFPEAQYSVIERAGEQIGRLIVDRAPDRILLIDIALLPEQREQGIGTSLIRDLMIEAEQTSKPLRLHVEFFNRALRLYERLGFSKIGEVGVYFEMEWRPPGR